jgi:two-component system nitrate/nitrite response regulator NarL
VRVLIVDDHKLFAEAIRSALRVAGMDVTAVATSGRDGVERARAERPDVVLLDLGLPDGLGVAFGAKILEECPDTKVLAVTALSDPALLKEAMKAGFHGYLTKDTDIRRFVESINTVMSGQVVIPHRLAAAAAESHGSEDGNAQLLAGHLTKRERSVLALLVQGASSDQIATFLSISPNTVRTHIQNVLTKLQVHSRLEAATFAVRHGIVASRSELGRRWPAPGSHGNGDPLTTDRGRSARGGYAHHRVTRSS